MSSVRAETRPFGKHVISRHDISTRYISLTDSVRLAHGPAASAEARELGGGLPGGELRTSLMLVLVEEDVRQSAGD